MHILPNFSKCLLVEGTIIQKQFDYIPEFFLNLPPLEFRECWRSITHHDHDWGCKAGLRFS
jgi:hypothetical protein